MGAMIVGKLRGGIDIRTMGSGNAGGTNALRTQGIGFAIGVVLIDIGKGVIGAGVVPGLAVPFVPADPELSRQWLTMCCAAAAVFGHVWPIYHRFRGGKGAATFVGTLIIVGPELIPPLILVWVGTIVISGYVGLATMFAAIAVAVASANFKPNLVPTGPVGGEIAAIAVVVTSPVFTSPEGAPPETAIFAHMP